MSRHTEIEQEQDEYIFQYKAKVSVDVRLATLSDAMDLVSAVHALMDNGENAEEMDKDEVLGVIGRILRKAQLHKVEATRIK